jgi:hypothetical protein
MDMSHSETRITRIWTAEAVYRASLGGKLGLPAPPRDWLSVGFTPSQQPYTQTVNCAEKDKNSPIPPPLESRGLLG